MITYIKGRLIEKTPTKIIVECKGIGYDINISLNTYENIPDEENIKIFTYMSNYCKKIIIIYFPFNIYFLRL